MAFVITIVGLDTVGSSIGLAIRQTAADIQIVGHDRDSALAKNAHKSGSVDHTEWNLPKACEGADLILVSTPLAEMKTTLAAIADDLKPGCVVTDTASLKVPVLQWAREFLPDTVHFVGGHPILDKTHIDLSSPHADLFLDSVYCLTPGTETPPEALQTVSDLAEAIGAKPYFLDAAEHDGLIAATEQAPLLLALALQQVVASSPSRREMIQLSGVDFTSVTDLLAYDAETLTELCAQNGDNIARWVDVLLPQLTQLRDWVAAQQTESLQEAFAAALEARNTWRREAFEQAPVDYSEFSAMRNIFGRGFQRSRKENPS
jgi:prephenate dehydrogenase